MESSRIYLNCPELFAIELFSGSSADTDLAETAKDAVRQRRNSPHARIPACGGDSAKVIADSEGNAVTLPG
jgi:hypothetical protein